VGDLVDNLVANSVLYIWLGLSTLVFLWFGGQCAWMYWHLPQEEKRFLTGRKKYSYYFGGLVVWGGFITLIPLVLYTLGRLWIYILIGGSNP
jgi:hypothetical protein